MQVKNIKIGSATNSSSYHSTVTFSKDNLDTYGTQISDIFIINGLKYPGIALAFTKKLIDLEAHKTQEQVNSYVGEIITETLQYLGFDADEVNWNPEDATYDEDNLREIFDIYE